MNSYIPRIIKTPSIHCLSQHFSLPFDIPVCCFHYNRVQLYLFFHLPIYWLYIVRVFCVSVGAQDRYEGQWVEVVRYGIHCSYCTLTCIFIVHLSKSQWMPVLAFDVLFAYHLVPITPPGTYTGSQRHSTFNKFENILFNDLFQSKYTEAIQIKHFYV